MSRLTRLEVPVVVVGAGPAGLVAAITLAGHGIETLVVERRATGPALPRATVLSLRTMELLRSWGLEQAVLAGADDVDMAMLLTQTLAWAAEGERVNVGYPSRAQSEVLSPTRAACVAQDHLEQVLFDHLETLPAASVVRGIEVTDIVDFVEQPRVEVRDHVTGERHSVTAEYVVGADGARSRVRAASGVRMVGPDSIFGGLLAEFRAPLWEVVGAQRFLLYGVTHPDAEATVLPAGDGDRWLIGLHQGAEELGDPPSQEVLTRQIRLAAGVAELPVRIDRSGFFTSGAQLADRFRVGRVFLAGDAAHRITPRGGTGLNTAIADGRDLGWKLLWVLRGWAAASFLSSYEAERRPPAQHNVTRSADPMGTRRGADTEVQIDLGGRIAHIWTVPPMASDAGRSTVDLVTAGLTLFVDADAGEWCRAAEGLEDDPMVPPIAAATLGTVTARALGIAPGGAMLVRPDGVPIAAWPATANAAYDVRRAVTAFLRGQSAVDRRQSQTAAA